MTVTWSVSSDVLITGMSILVGIGITLWLCR